MKLKSFLLSVALPLFLGAVILGLGSLIPNRLLEGQKENYLQRLTSVEVEDVRPYGDEYAQMRQDLLGAVRIVKDAHYDRELTQSQMQQVEDGLIEGFPNFFRQWQDALGERGYEFLLPERMEVGGQTYLSNASTDGEWVLLLELWDPVYDSYTNACVDDGTGTPVQLQLWGMMDEYISPWILWDSLLATYQGHCGLLFGDAVTSVELNWKELSEAEDQVLIEEMVNSAAYGEEETQVEFSALSTDLTFRLRLSVASHGGTEWFAVIKLTENVDTPAEYATDAGNKKDTTG